MQIGEVARRTGLSADTLRFYEKIGLIAPPARDQAGRRVYDAPVLGWIRFLEQLNATGMKQADRVQYAALRRQGPATSAARRQMLERHRRHIQAQLEQLTETLALMDRKIADYESTEQAMGQTGDSDE